MRIILGLCVSVSWGLCMPVCVNVSMYVCVYIHLWCMLVFMCMYALCMCMCTCVYVCACEFICVYMCICVYLCCVCVMHVCECVYVCECRYRCTHVYECACTCVCVWGEGLRVCVTVEKNSACPRDSGGARHRVCVSGFLGVGRCACLQASCPRTAASLSDWLHPRQSEAPESCGNLVTW